MRKIIALLLFLGLLAAVGCGGGIAPAPPAEIPSVLAFPASLATDYNEVKETGGSSISPTINTAVGSISKSNKVGSKVAPGGTYSDLVAGGGTLMDALNAFNDIVIAVWSGIEIPTDPDTTTYTRPADAEIVVTRKMSFADFDLDGDGTPEGCSGSTCPVDCSIATCPPDATGFTCPTTAPTASLLPVCVRLWTDPTVEGVYERIIAMRLDVIPTPILDAEGRVTGFSNVGNGSYRATVDSESDFCTAYYPGYPYLYGFLGSNYTGYSATDSNLASTEVYIMEDCRSGSGGSGTIGNSFNHHGISNQATSSWSSNEVVKELNYAFCSGDIVSDVQICDSWAIYVSNFMGDDSISTNNYWRGYVDVYPGADPISNQCVDLDTGNAPVTSDSSILYCGRLDAEAEAQPWLDNEEFATESDVAFPSVSQFPLEPWF